MSKFLKDKKSFESSKMDFQITVNYYITLQVSLVLSLDHHLITLHYVCVCAVFKSNLIVYIYRTVVTVK